MDRSKRFVYPLILVAALLLVPTSAFADLIGSDVTVRWYYPDLSTVLGETVVTVVDPGVEITCTGGAGDPDVCFFATPTTINISGYFIVFAESGSANWDNPTFNGLAFEDLNFGPAVTFTGYNLTSTNIPGLDPSRITTGSNYIRVNMSGLSYGEGGGTFTLELHASDEPSGVPEPGTMSLLFGGLVLGGGCYFLRRRRA